MIGDRTHALARLLLREGYASDEQEALLAAAEVLQLAGRVERAQPQPPRDSPDAAPLAAG